MKKIVKKIVHAVGIDIRRKPYSSLVSSGEIESAIQSVEKYTMLPRERLISLYDQVVFCERQGIEGALVECGVWKGGAVALMAKASKLHSKKSRHIHLFDSFLGICEPNAEYDGKRALEEVAPYTDAARGRLEPVQGFYDSVGGHGTLEANRELLEKEIGYPADFLHYHVGWFQQTVPQSANSIGAIAILRLDGDWYESTRICLDFLYDSVQQGGFVIIDDYGTYDGCRRAVDEFIANRQIRGYLHPVDAACRYLVKT